tara:strand:+ start:421 stop:639 length:219 start_codon:yes stop_codon:yes gene_type:complete
VYVTGGSNVKKSMISTGLKYQNCVGPLSGSEEWVINLVIDLKNRFPSGFPQNSLILFPMELNSEVSLGFLVE